MPGMENKSDGSGSGNEFGDSGQRFSGVSFHDKASEFWAVVNEQCGFDVDEYLHQPEHDQQLSETAGRVGLAMEDYCHKMLEGLMLAAYDETGREMTAAEARMAVIGMWAHCLLDYLSSLDSLHLAQLRRENPDAAADMRRAIYRGMPFDGADDKDKEGEGSLESTNDID